MSSGNIDLDNNKKLYGQFFTINNPFFRDVFMKWVKVNDTHGSDIFIEPFAGANNIVNMIREMGLKNEWRCYDISPNEDNQAPDVAITEQDTLANYPKGVGNVAITNPPYLARNSATRDGMSFPDTKHDDLYKHSLEVMLEHTPYVAAIIPASFLQTALFRNRLYAVVLLECKMFGDTDCPVCLAMFVPSDKKSLPITIKSHCITGDAFVVYSNDHLIGTFKKLAAILPSGYDGVCVFNDPAGSIGLKAIDDTKGRSIGFVNGDDIDPADIKTSSRHKTRIQVNLQGADRDKVIAEANAIISSLRTQTHDALLTTFKGLRNDGLYRRRISFAQAKQILLAAIESTKESKVATNA